MKNKNETFYLKNILEAIGKIKDYTKGLTKDIFFTETIVVDASIRNLEIIGEAAKGLSKEFRDKYSEIPWQDIIGLRNILIHEYFGIDLDIIWELITKDMLDLEVTIIDIMNNDK